MLGNYSIVRAVGVGTASFQRESQPPMLAIDLLYVPGLKKNLISVYTIEARAFSAPSLGTNPQPVLFGPLLQAGWVRTPPPLTNLSLRNRRSYLTYIYGTIVTTAPAHRAPVIARRSVAHSPFATYLFNNLPAYSTLQPRPVPVKKEVKPRLVYTTSK